VTITLGAVFGFLPPRWSSSSPAGSRPPHSPCDTPASSSASVTFEHLDAKPGHYTEKNISPYLWHNGKYPDTDEYKMLYESNFADYRLRIGGLVANPIELDLTELHALTHHEQITQRFCIQGCSGIAKWGGVSTQTILDLVKPCPEAKWVVFYSLSEAPTEAPTTTRTRSSR
jgi:methionine sulfoxide reductase catalytic subunit